MIRLLTVLLSRLWIVFVMLLNIWRATLMCYSHDSRNWIPRSGEMMGSWILLPISERKGTCKTKGWDISNALPFLEREKARYEDDRYVMYYIQHKTKHKANVIWSYIWLLLFPFLDRNKRRRWLSPKKYWERRFRALFGNLYHLLYTTPSKSGSDLLIFILIYIFIFTLSTSTRHAI